MNKLKVARTISFGGLLVSLAALFQSAPIFFPNMGLLLSPLSTLPIALAAYFSLPLGITVLFSSVAVLLIISPQEAIILLLTTGLLGAVLGSSIKKGMLYSIVISAASLFVGINVLTYMIGIAAFGDFTSSFPIIAVILIFLAFSLVYSSIWALSLKLFFKRTKQNITNP